jgi:hypothetical protein
LGGITEELVQLVSGFKLSVLSEARDSRELTMGIVLRELVGDIQIIDQTFQAVCSEPQNLPAFISHMLAKSHVTTILLWYSQCTA